MLKGSAFSAQANIEGTTEALRNVDQGRNLVDADNWILEQAEKKKRDTSNGGDMSSTVFPY
jgi:hypothetical protein